MFVGQCVLFLSALKSRQIPGPSNFEFKIISYPHTTVTSKPHTRLHSLSSHSSFTLSASPPHRTFSSIQIRNGPHSSSAPNVYPGPSTVRIVPRFKSPNPLSFTRLKGVINYFFHK